MFAREHAVLSPPHCLHSSFYGLRISLVNHLRNTFLLNSLQMRCFSLAFFLFHFSGMWAPFLLSVTKEVVGREIGLYWRRKTSPPHLFPSPSILQPLLQGARVLQAVYFKAQVGESRYWGQMAKTPCMFLDDGGDRQAHYQERLWHLCLQSF